MTNENDEYLKSKIKELLESHDIKQYKHSILRSDRHSDTYIKKVLITLFPKLYNEIICAYLKIIMKSLSTTEYDIIASPAVTGICYGSPVAANLNKPFAFTERNRIAEGCFGSAEFRPEFERYIKDLRFIIIEDIITIGGSTKKICESITRNGGYTVAVFCLWNRDPDNDSLSYPHIAKYPASCMQSKAIPIYSIINKK